MSIMKDTRTELVLLVYKRIDNYKILLNIVRLMSMDGEYKIVVLDENERK